jgi:hypothetical protein
VQEIEEEKNTIRKERLVRNLHYTSLAYQRMAEMLNGEMQASSDCTKALRMEEAAHALEMYKSKSYKPFL